VILQFDPSCHVEAIKPKTFRPPPDWAQRGEMTKLVLSILRQATEPMMSRDIASKCSHPSVDKNDQNLLPLIERIGAALHLQRLNGSVCSSSGTGQYIIWEVAR
jgi:hypothetical protein